jgi:uncharacterized protein YdeI (YjbR/CyaY-like superfamily)
MDPMMFKDKNAFNEWLFSHHEKHPGIWIRFDKLKQTSSLTPFEALDVALCYGWIDGLLKRLDDQFYIKYFAKRTLHSIWSTRNKGYAQKLIDQGLMMPAGFEAMELAKKDGRWEKADLPPEDFDIEDFKQKIGISQKALMTYQSFTPSIQKIYALSYYMLKKPESRQKRLAVIIERLEKGLKPM